jgi:hypothetical protein
MSIKREQWKGVSITWEAGANWEDRRLPFITVFEILSSISFITVVQLPGTDNGRERSKHNLASGC